MNHPQVSKSHDLLTRTLHHKTASSQEAADEAQILELDTLCKIVNRTRQRLKREYFNEKLQEAKGDLKVTWEVLGELLNGRKRKKGVTCRYFEKDGQGITDGQEIAEEFCKF